MAKRAVSVTFTAEVEIDEKGPDGLHPGEGTFRYSVGASDLDADPALGIAVAALLSVVGDHLQTIGHSLVAEEWAQEGTVEFKLQATGPEDPLPGTTPAEG